jgi:hypothetical protein
MFSFVVCINGIYYRIYSVQICSSVRNWRSIEVRYVRIELNFVMISGSIFVLSGFMNYPFLMNKNPLACILNFMSRDLATNACGTITKTLIIKDQGSRM